jgi:hypothetical protein
MDEEIKTQPKKKKPSNFQNRPSKVWIELKPKTKQKKGKVPRPKAKQDREREECDRSVKGEG